MKYQIRRLFLGEFALFKSLRLASLSEAPEAFGTSLASALTRDEASWMAQADGSATGPDRATFVILSDEPVGLASVYRDSTQQDVGELLQVWVAPSLRGSAAAVRLMDAVLQWAAENGMQTIRAEVTRNNQRALRFYLRYGFHHTEPDKCSPNEPHTLLFRQKSPLPIAVNIQPYSPTWPELALAEIRLISSLFGAEGWQLHHIGSTAVPGLAAKPILDLMGVVPHLDEVDAANERLAAVGFRAWGELGIPGRRYFTKDQTGIRHAQLHCFAQGSPHVLRHLALRDYLREHADIAAAYAAEKRLCAAQHPLDSHAYGAAKAAWVSQAETEALAWAKLR